MKTSTAELPSWIRQYAYLGPTNLSVEATRTEQNLFWYTLPLCCPQIFEAYAIVLHPFGVNWKIKAMKDTETARVSDEDFELLTWKEFFRLYDKPFHLSIANETCEEIRKQIVEGDWPPHLWYPTEGDCSSKQLEFILGTILDLHKDHPVSCYYMFMKTNDWSKEDVILKGQLSEYERFRSLHPANNCPTAMYPDNARWCIISDYDLPFTFIGGSRELIRKLSNEALDIFEIKPRFRTKEKAPSTQA